METLVRVRGGCLSRSCDSIKSSRIAQLCYTAKAALIALERVFVHCSRVARRPELKNQAPFLNRLVGGLPFGLVEFSWDLQVV